MTIKDKLMIYIYRKINELEQDKLELKKQVRLQPLDSLDMYEIMRNEIRLNAWNEFINDIYNIVINCK